MQEQKTNTIKVLRFNDNKQATFSKIYLNDKFLCFGLENAFHQIKIPKQTRIAEGTYELKLRKFGGFHKKYSKKFKFHKGMLEICEVPNFTDILFHIGNFPQDTDGCILVGQSCDLAKNIIHNSTSAYIKFYKKIIPLILANEKVLVEIFQKEVVPNE